MAVEKTFSMIKPDAVAKNYIGNIIQRFEKAGLRIVAAKMIHLSRDQAERFYAIHREKHFYRELIEFMVSGPVFAQVLQGESAIEKNREIMGSTNPANALPGTIRAELAESTTQNAIHGSDSPETVQQEIAFFFSEVEIFSYGQPEGF